LKFLAEKKVCVVECGFCWGYSRFCGGLCVVNRGEVVVECVANVVSCRPLFKGLKVGHLFQLYFHGPQIGNDEAA
jgi:hypothetical protein